jgi:hypothetical protein
MKNTLKKAVCPLGLAALVLLLIPGVLSAHHNHQVMANYDKLVAVTGVVTQHEFINPHCVIHVTATDKDGTTEEWQGYGGTPGMEERLGYSAHMFKLGEEKITMYGFPNKDGRKFMIYVKMVRANGEEIPVYQTMKNDLDAFMAEHKVESFKDMPESDKRFIGGPAFQANDDK